MDPTSTMFLLMKIIALVIVCQAVAWGLVFWRLRMQAQQVRNINSRGQEKLVLGPHKSTFQSSRSAIVYSSTMGILALTDKRILFKRPLGRDVSVPLNDVMAAIDASKQAVRNRYNLPALGVQLRNDKLLIFLVSDADPWMREIRARSGK